MNPGYVLNAFFLPQRVVTVFAGNYVVLLKATIQRYKYPPMQNHTASLTL